MDKGGRRFLTLGLGSSVLAMYSLMSDSGNFYVVPNRIQCIFEGIYDVIFNMINDNVGAPGKPFFPYIFTLFTFVLISNIIGLVPYSFTVTTTSCLQYFNISLFQIFAFFLFSFSDTVLLLFDCSSFNISCARRYTDNYIRISKKTFFEVAPELAL